MEFGESSFCIGFTVAGDTSPWGLKAPRMLFMFNQNKNVRVVKSSQIIILYKHREVHSIPKNV